jgi:segregation and condensation protein B
VLFNDELGADTIKDLLGELQQEWTQRGVELVCVATAGASRAGPRCANTSTACIPRSRPSTAARRLETLAIIAYRSR